MDIEIFKKIMWEKIKLDESMRKVAQPEPESHTEPVRDDEQPQIDPIEPVLQGGQPQVEPVPPVVEIKKRRLSKKFRKMMRIRNSRTRPISVRLLKANFEFLKGKCRSEIINNLITTERLKVFTKEKDIEHYKRVLEGKEGLYS